MGANRCASPHNPLKTCLVAIVGSKLHLKMSTYELLRIAGVSLFDKTPLRELLKDEPE
jgi:hypothetical protein